MSFDDKNVERARKMLQDFVNLHNESGYITVNKDYSVLILNLLSCHCRIENISALGDDSMGASIQGLRHVHEEHGHYRNRIVNEETERAKKSSEKKPKY